MNAVPAHLAEPGQARHLPPDAGRQHAVLVEPVAVDLDVLGVHVEDPVGELVDRALVVDQLPDEVRRVEVEAEVGVGDDLEHPPPDRRANARLLPPGHSSSLKIIGQFSIAICDAVVAA